VQLLARFTVSSHACSQSGSKILMANCSSSACVLRFAFKVASAIGHKLYRLIERTSFHVISCAVARLIKRDHLVSL